MSQPIKFAKGIAKLTRSQHIVTYHDNGYSLCGRRVETDRYDQPLVFLHLCVRCAKIAGL